MKKLLLLAVLAVGCTTSDPVKEYGGSIVGVLRSDDRIGGTAFYIKDKGQLLLVSAGHVCDSAGPVAYIKKQDGKKGTARVIAKHSNTSVDLCVLSPSISGRPLPLGKEAKVGMKVVAVGHGLGYPLWEREGRILTEEQAIEVGICDPFANALGVPGCIITYLNAFTNAAIQPGHSGSPFISDGKVVGVASTGSPSGISGIVTVQRLRELLKQLPERK